MHERAEKKEKIKANHELRNMRCNEDLCQDCSEKPRRTNPNPGGFLGPRCHEVLLVREPDVLATRRRHGGDWLGTSLATIVAEMPIMRLAISGGANVGRDRTPKTTRKWQIKAKCRSDATP